MSSTRFYSRTSRSSLAEESTDGVRRSLFYLEDSLQSATSEDRWSKSILSQNGHGAEIAHSEPARFVILGGGFAGIATTRRLERLLSPQQAEITVVSRENFSGPRAAAQRKLHPRWGALTRVRSRSEGWRHDGILPGSPRFVRGRLDAVTIRTTPRQAEPRYNCHSHYDSSAVTRRDDYSSYASSGSNYDLPSCFRANPSVRYQ